MSQREFQSSVQIPSQTKVSEKLKYIFFKSTFLKTVSKVVQRESQYTHNPNFLAGPSGKILETLEKDWEGDNESARGFEGRLKS